MTSGISAEYVHFTGGVLNIITKSGGNTFTVTFIFFFNDTATTKIYTLSLHDALPIYRRHVHHGAASGLERRPQPLRQRDAREQVDVEDVQPVDIRHLERADLSAVRPLRRDRRIVDQRVQAVAHDVAQAGHLRFHPSDIGQVELDMVLRPAFPRAARIEWMPRDGQHTPPGVAEGFHRGVADASAGTG